MWLMFFCKGVICSGHLTACRSSEFGVQDFVHFIRCKNITLSLVSSPFNWLATMFWLACPFSLLPACFELYVCCISYLTPCASKSYDWCCQVILEYVSFIQRFCSLDASVYLLCHLFFTELRQKVSECRSSFLVFSGHKYKWALRKNLWYWSGWRKCTE